MTQVNQLQNVVQQRKTLISSSQELLTTSLMDRVFVLQIAEHIIAAFVIHHIWTQQTEARAAKRRINLPNGCSVVIHEDGVNKKPGDLLAVRCLALSAAYLRERLEEDRRSEEQKRGPIEATRQIHADQRGEMLQALTDVETAADDSPSWLQRSKQEAKQS